MHIVLLRFTENRLKAAQFMDDHNTWIQRGFEDGMFLLVGALQPGVGGAILAASVTAEELIARVNQDPFVTEGIVEAEILEISPKRTDPRLDFLRA